MTSNIMESLCSKLLLLNSIHTTIALTITITTPRQSGTYEYTMLNDHGYALPVGQTYVVLSVMTSNDAHICLTYANTSTPQLTQYYEIVVGGWSNSKSVVRRSKQGHNEVMVPGAFLSQTEFDIFNISWTNALIHVEKLNKGTCNWVDVMQWQDTVQLPVSYIGVSTGPWADGVWKITDDTALLEGQCHRLSSTTSTSVSTSTNAISPTSSSSSSSIYSSKSNSSLCTCTCVYVNVTEHSSCKGDLTCQLNELRQKLLLNKALLSSTWRRKNSARDDRTSSKFIGAFGASILILVILSIVLPDLCTVVAYALRHLNI